MNTPTRNRLALILDGELRDQLLTRREQGDSLDDMVNHLGKLGVFTNRETLRQYFLSVEEAV